MRFSRERLLCSLAGIAIAGLLTGCGDDDGADSTPATSTSTSTSVSGEVPAKEESITLRPVVGESPPPCAPPSPPAEIVLSSSSGKTCLALGAAGLDVSDIASARLDTDDETAVWLALTDSGRRRFDEMAAAHPGKNVAAVANGRVVMSIPIDSTDRASIRNGGEVFVVGFTQSEAAELLSALAQRPTR